MDKFSISSSPYMQVQSEQTQELAERVGFLQHHDTITGTSYRYVNDDMLYHTEELTESTEDVLIEKIKQLGAYQGLSFSNITYCMHRVNQRYLMCPDSALDNDFYLLVYNPSLVDSNLTSIHLSSSKVEISLWAPQNKTFEIAKAEAFCYPNLDNQTHGDECEVHIYQYI
jgi:hypothetical protein